MYTREQFAKMIDNTLLRPDAAKVDIVNLCQQSMERHFATVCILPCWVGTAARLLEGTDVKVCTVVSFPLGADTRLCKSFAVKDAIANGAREIDAVMALGRFKSWDYAYVEDDLRSMVEACGAGHPDGDSRKVQLKVIIEACLLTDEEKEIAARMVLDSGADFVKTSTGTAGGGATIADVQLLRSVSASSAFGVKASGGIRTLDAAIAMLDAGANRIGTSNGAALYDSYIINAL